jgi:peptide/nickel transport system permease protein
VIDTLLRRIAQSAVVVLAMSLLAFVGIHLVGDPVYLLVDPAATAAELEAARQSLGLDRPIHQQYFSFLGSALSGDLGRSFVFNQPALGLILERLPATLELAFVSLIISAVIGIPLGLAVGLRDGGWLKRIVSAGSIAGVTVPAFWLSLLLILLFSVNLGWLPSSGRGPVGTLLGIRTSLASWEGLSHLLLPALTLAFANTAIVIRLTEAGTREVVQQEYVRFARAKGVGPLRLMARHIAPNVMIPVVTALGLEFGHLIAFSVVTETVFAWPGMGKLIIDSILRLDRPVVVAYLMVTLLMFVLINLVVDLLYVVLDPRLRTKASA